MFLLRQPSRLEIERFLTASRELPISYDPIGLARDHRTGFDRDEEVVIIGHGQADYGRAVDALAAWRHFELGWTAVFPEQASIMPGTVVAVLIHHLGFCSLNGCRIVYQLGNRDDGDFGFAYGTLTNHAESGEEIFRVRLDPISGEVSYIIRASSRPRAMLARLGYPVVRSLQARFRRDSAAAMTRVIAGTRT